MAGGVGEVSAAPVIVPATAGGATLLGLATEQWLTIAAGLVIGMVAHWALLLHARKALGWRQIRIDAMMFAANGVLAAQAADAAGLTGVKLLTAAMLFGAGSTILFGKARAKWFAEQGALPVSPLPPGSAAELIQAPGRVLATVEEAETQEPIRRADTVLPKGRRAGVGKALRRTYRSALLPELTPEERALLRLLDEADGGNAPTD
jgi:hypothetical protein